MHRRYAHLNRRAGVWEKRSIAIRIVGPAIAPIRNTVAVAIVSIPDSIVVAFIGVRISALMIFDRNRDTSG
jgi:hypothetical protein